MRRLRYWLIRKLAGKDLVIGNVNTTITMTDSIDVAGRGAIIFGNTSGAEVK